MSGNVAVWLAAICMAGRLTAGVVYTITDLGALGLNGSYGMGINSAGQVTGGASSLAGNNEHAFLYSDGVMQDLGTLGGASSLGTAINDAGQITGGADLVNATHAFLYSGGRMMDLNSLIDPLPGVALVSAHGINDKGPIMVRSRADWRCLPGGWPCWRCSAAGSGPNRAVPETNSNLLIAPV